MTELGNAATIGQVTSVHDLVPDDQLEKQPILRRIGHLLSRINPSDLTQEERDRAERLERMAAATPFVLNDLPDAVKKQFEPRDIALGPGHFVLAYPTVSMGEASAVRQLAGQLRDFEIGAGVRLSAAGEPMILADILEIVQRDAPRILSFILVLVLLALRVMAGSLKLALLSLFPAVLTVAATAGLLAVLRIELNYLNMIMLPILLGIGVDDGMHVVTRVAAGEPLIRVWAHTGWDIFGAIITDIFGFGVLAFASHPGLASLGKVAIVGLCVNLVACVVFLPALLAVTAKGAPNLTPMPPTLR
ncbi:MAG TPA: MMPL family transporter [Polyangiaceae bacterium]|nr:MMPL family transporter [Polyangiaceae bacterium]